MKVLSTPRRPGAEAACAAGPCAGRVAGDRRPDAAGPRHDRGHQRAARAARRTGGAGHHRGFADVIEIARQDRPSLYDIWADRPRAAGAPGRCASRSAAASTPTAASSTGRPGVEVPALADGRRGGGRLPAARRSRPGPRAGGGRRAARSRGIDVSCSSEVSPEFREYERTVTTVVNAYLRPVCRPYLRAARRAGRRGAGHDLGRRAGAGATRRPACRPRCCCRARPAGCGPAAAVAAACGYPDAVTFDMGGTSTDVCLVLGGVPEPAAGPGGGRAAGAPARRSTSTPSAPAAARSPASTPAAPWSSGPRAPGADPGPACYGRGGTAPTVTDADLVARPHPRRRRLPRRSAASTRDAAARRRWSRSSAGRRGDAGRGVVAVVDAAMEQAVRAGDGGAGRRPGRAGPGGLRRRRPAARLRPGRRARHGGGGRAAPGRRAVRRRPAVPPRQRDLVRSWPDARRPRRPGRGAGGPRRRARRRGHRRRRWRRVRGDGAGRRPGSRSSRPRLPLPGPEPRAERAVDRGLPRRARAPQRLRPARRAGRGRGPAGPGPPAGAARAGRPARSRSGRCTGPAVVAEPTARSGSPTAGWPSPARSAPGSCTTGPAATVHRRRRRRLSQPVAVRGLRRRAGGAPRPRPGRAAGPDRPARPAWPRRWARCCAGRRSAPTSRSGPTARRRCSPPTASCWSRPSTSPSTSGRCRRRCAAAIDAFGDAGRARRAGHPQRPLRRRHPPQRHHARRPLLHVDGALVGWAANRAHHADVGGMAPGSIPPEATEIYQEGLRLPPVLLTAEVRASCCANSRTPDERRGDLDAQRGANRVGVRPAGRRWPARPLDEVVAYGERRMRAALAGAARRRLDLRRRPRLHRPGARPAAGRPAIARRP